MNFKLIKSMLQARIDTAQKKYMIANKVNNVSAMSGWSFVIAELNDLLQQISQVEEASWKKKLLVKQLKSELSHYNLSQDQLDKLATLLMESNLPLSHYKIFLDIIAPLEQTGIIDN
ncbi:hypothetical protein GGQ84_001259 [Desulfitispora alkaliphila]|uniref:hypothetical protein n=1 Tax=Desulfitispora alkaliphila TaxID=622674 RepID=UPI003D24F3A0